MYIIEPAAFVKNNRADTNDDFWGEIISDIVISNKLSPECIQEIQEFSHLEIIFYFHLADLAKVNVTSSYTRNIKKFPKVGIFAQRKKARPYLLGSTIVKLIDVKGNTLTVSGLEAVNGTPVIDIKPVFKEFMPDEEIVQPEWVIK